MSCRGEPLLQDDCSMNEKEILYAFERDTLKKSLECLEDHKKEFAAWDRFPLIPNFQETYFWEILRLSWKAEQQKVKYFMASDNQAWLYHSDSIPLLYYMARVSKDWAPVSFVPDSIERIFLARELARRLLMQDTDTDQFYRYLCRYLLIEKYKIREHVHLSPFEMRKEYEKDVREAYHKQMKTKEKFTQVKPVWDTIQKIFPDLMESVKKSAEYKAWKKATPMKYFRLKVKDAFPAETRSQYPFSIPMFERMFADLKKGKID